jgi:hypothetical protein
MGFHAKGAILLDAPTPGMLHPYDEFQKDWTGVVIAFPEDENEAREFVARIGDSTSWSAWTIRGSIVAFLVALAWLFSHRRVLARRNDRAAFLSRISRPFLKMNRLDRENQSKGGADASGT